MHFGQNNFSEYDTLIKITNKTLVGQKLLEAHKNTTKEDKKEKLKARMDKLLEEIKVLKTKYLNMTKSDQAVKGAYVVFRSFEGYERVKRVFKDSMASRCWLTCTCRKNKYKEKLFQDKYLKVS